MDGNRDTTVGAGVSLAIIVIAGLILLFFLVSFLNEQSRLHDERTGFFGTTPSGTSGPQGGTQNPATTTPRTEIDASFDVDIDVDKSSKKTETSTHDEDNDVAPINVSPSVNAPVSGSTPINLPVVAPLLRGLGF